MSRRPASAVLLVSASLLGSSAAAAPATRAAAANSRPPLQDLSPQARLDAVHRAQVWQAVDVTSMDITAGPQGKGSLPPGEAVSCTFVDRKLSGHSAKFACATDDGDELKVRYGADNGEIYAGVAATRLFWALGFGADAMYPVQVTCHGCPSDPWHDGRPAPEPPIFDFATVEHKMPGKTMESPGHDGWTWGELDRVDETSGGAPRAQRDALKLLAALVQHVDSKARQQRLVCLPGGAVEGRPQECSRPFMMVADLGVTFGRSHWLSRHLNQMASMNLENWSKVPVWKDPQRCVASLQRSFSGTLDDPRISEAGRKFLADLLAQLTDQQVHDLFAVARVDRRPRDPGHGTAPASVEDWVSVFTRKRQEIVSHTCPQ